ncbi:MAG: hypothetical protein C0436_00395 [Alphaproteobacteria bacterium]|nr:hypothetical protein [Alphaproteobacteria bacterium]
MEQEPAWKALLRDKKDAIVIPALTESEVLEAVSQFLLSEPNWLDNAIANDAALQTHPDGTSVSKAEAYTQLFTYQGLHAIALHRQAHALYDKGKIAEARSLSQAARHITGGIEIHPGAKIGRGFFVDHGAGVVIGETAEIGDNVFLYHSVTLGATGNSKDIDTSDPKNPARRHPKLGSNVKIANGAQLIGPVTVEDNVSIATGARIIGKVRIGKGAKIGPGVEVQSDVPPGAVVVGMVPEIPGVIGKDEGARTPITRLTPNTRVSEVAWLGHLARGYEKLAEHASNARVH